LELGRRYDDGDLAVLCTERETAACWEIRRTLVVIVVLVASALLRQVQISCRRRSFVLCISADRYSSTLTTFLLFCSDVTMQLLQQTIRRRRIHGDIYYSNHSRLWVINPLCMFSQLVTNRQIVPSLFMFQTIFHISSSSVNAHVVVSEYI